MAPAPPATAEITTMASHNLGRALIKRFSPGCPRLAAALRYPACRDVGFRRASRKT
jgi:hypothetical protein